MNENDLLIAGERPKRLQRVWAWIVSVFSKKSDDSNKLNEADKEAISN